MNAIPTRYSNVEFRSRLEARWAAFFDALKWPWLYEPIDLRAYIPDFILSFPAGPLLAEVKPCVQFDDLAVYKEKILNSGWNGFALLLGANGPGDPGYGYDGPALGLLVDARRDVPPDASGFVDHDFGILYVCTKCWEPSVREMWGCWDCKRCGHYEGDAGLMEFPLEKAQVLWAEAGNTVQWNPSRQPAPNSNWRDLVFDDEWHRRAARVQSMMKEMDAIHATLKPGSTGR